MTAWADYPYYTDEYLAGRTPTVSEADFRSYAVSATAYAKRITGDSIDDGAVPDDARCAVCAIAEVLCTHDAASTGVSSEKVGDMSVTYESAAARDAAMMSAINGIARTWLSPWLYLGVRDAD